MKHLAPVALIINPVATRAGRGPRAEVTRVLSERGLEWSLTTAGPGDGARLARQAAREGARVVVTLGGDGTAAEAAGALAGGPVVMAPMPGGNANVFCRALGWPARATRALPALAAALERGLIRDVTLGRLHLGDDERVFAINAGMGIDAAAVEWIEARPRTKKRLRHLGFALGALAAVRAAREPHLLASSDGQEWLEAVAVLVACGTPYTYLGSRPLDLVPGAAFDGDLAWIALARVRPRELSGLVLGALRGRPPAIDGPALRGGTATAHLIVRAEPPAPVQADGEPLGRHAQMRVTPGPVLRVLDPRRAGGLKFSAVPPT
jgi:diacylglycerol kinase family enzyme